MAAAAYIVPEVTVTEDGVDACVSGVVPSPGIGDATIGLLDPDACLHGYTGGRPRARKAITGEIEIDGEGGRRTLRSTCDWTETALNGEHLWLPTSASGDLCYVSEHDCCKTGSRMKCAACKIVCHTGCIANLTDKIKFGCKPSFRDVGVRQYRDNTATAHHWVHRRNLKGKCKHCSKSFTSKLSFSNTKEIVAISCSWCKTAYHNKEPCFSIQRLEEQCSLGVHADIIVPPSWIVKLPRRGSFKSSLRKSPKKRSSSRRKSKERVDKDQSRTFAIKPIPTPNVKPLVVFLNPKSGGNQGVKLMQKFQWLLNPRQVFDLTQGGPKAGLEMYRKVPNLRVLACGGDGTVGWVLSVLDQMNFNPPPAIGVLPLGTGNDLARSLGWGGGYTDEPISKILCNISDGESQELDRWEAKVVPNLEADISEPGKDNLPLNVINNYFSLGVDAQIALQFHEAREARPDKFSSRLRNKVFYGQAGGRDLLQRKWKDLSEHVTILCDDKDITPKLKEHKVHAVLFLNIPSYGGGTHPWGGREQSTSDGCMEVIGLTTYQLPLLHAGGHGTVLAQCRKAELVTRCTIPMQVDGEACRVSPSVISISHLNRARMICKRRGRKSSSVEAHLEQMKIRISRISMADYEQYHYDKETLIQHSRALGVILVDMDADLEQVRQHINRLEEDSQQIPSLSSDWCFVDSCTAERFFRIDRAQEQLHYVTDVCAEHLYVLDTAAVVSPKLPVSNNNLLEHTSENIIIAAHNGDLTRVKQLHGSGVSLLSVNESGETALHVACAGGHKDVVRFLLANAPGSMVNMRDSMKGHTSLHRAASCCRRTICSMLVASGGSLTLLDNDGVTAKQMACIAGDPELAAYLESQERFQMMVADDHETSV